MLVVLVLLILVVPFAELWFLLQVANVVGGAWTILALVGVSIAGGWLMRREGVGLLGRIQKQLAAGELPAKSVVDGALILFAGALLITPGFLTDVVGLLLLFPPTRAVARTMLLRRFRSRLIQPGGRVFFDGGAVFDDGAVDGDVIDADSEEMPVDGRWELPLGDRRSDEN